MDAMYGFFSMCAPHKDGGYDNHWVSCGDNGKAVMYYLLNDGSDLLGDLDTASVADVAKYFYFDTEIECHRALYRYYTVHGVDNPHIGRYNEIINEQPIVLDDTQTIVVSEVMEFI